MPSSSFAVDDESSAVVLIGMHVGHSLYSNISQILNHLSVTSSDFDPLTSGNVELPRLLDHTGL